MAEEVRRRNLAVEEEERRRNPAAEEEWWRLHPAAEGVRQQLPSEAAPVVGKEVRRHNPAAGTMVVWRAVTHTTINRGGKRG